MIQRRQLHALERTINGNLSGDNCAMISVKYKYSILVQLTRSRTLCAVGASMRKSCGTCFTGSTSRWCSHCGRLARITLTSRSSYSNRDVDNRGRQNGQSLGAGIVVRNSQQIRTRSAFVVSCGRSAQSAPAGSNGVTCWHACMHACGCASVR
jgi:hypothetical protein